MKLEKKNLILLSVLGVLLIIGAVMYFLPSSDSVDGSQEFVEQMVNQAAQTPEADIPPTTPPGGRMKKID